ncbi:MAG: nidogen-like domain-containing protein, partial [Pseudomonadota bacterium]
FINANGSITFQEARPDFTPEPLGQNLLNPEITPFFGDVDTRLPEGVVENGPGTVTPSPGGNSAGTNLVWYELDTDGNRLVVTWDDVGYFFNNVEQVNAFQLIIEKSGGQNFDFEFRYEDINWTTGDSSGGVDGLGGTVARAGYTTGSLAEEGFLELPASGDEAAILTLDETPGNLGEAGVWRFTVRDGLVDTLNDRLTGNNAANDIRGGAGLDTITGGGGDDLLYGNLSDDLIYGNAGNDQLFGGQQRDTLFGGRGDDVIRGGGDTDVLYGNLDNDMMFGGDGADTFFGGQGIDTMTGGAGADRFVPGRDMDVITDFDVSQDRIIANGVSFRELIGILKPGARGETIVEFDNGGGFVIENLAFSSASIFLFE